VREDFSGSIRSSIAIRQPEPEIGCNEDIGPKGRVVSGTLSRPRRLDRPVPERDRKSSFGFRIGKIADTATNVFETVIHAR